MQLFSKYKTVELINNRKTDKYKSKKAEKRQMGRGYDTANYKIHIIIIFSKRIGVGSSVRLLRLQEKL